MSFMDIFDRGGPVMYPLLFCSLITLTVIIERAIFWLAIDLGTNKSLVENILDLCRSSEWKKAHKLATGRRNMLLRVLDCGILHRRSCMSKAMEAVAMDEVKKMQRFMGVLDTMITVAPLLGIFGTVTGIISSFDMLGSGGIDDPGTVMNGIAQALITTATGLGIAILTLFPYNYFNSRIEDAISNLESCATRLEIIGVAPGGTAPEYPGGRT